MEILGQQPDGSGYHAGKIKLKALWRALAAGALVPLIVLSYDVASGSVKRLYTAYLFAQGQSPSDDLTLAHVDVLPEFAAWGIVLAAIILAAFLIRYLRRSRLQTG